MTNLENVNRCRWFGVLTLRQFFAFLVSNYFIDWFLYSTTRCHQSGDTGSGFRWRFHKHHIPKRTAVNFHYIQPCDLFATFQNVILAVIGIPGALFAGWCVELKGFGRKGTLAVSSCKLKAVSPSGQNSTSYSFVIFQVLTGIFICASATAKSSNQLLGWNCGYIFCSNVRLPVCLFSTKLPDRVLCLLGDVRRFIRYVSGAFPNEGSRNRQCAYCDC